MCCSTNMSGETYFTSSITSQTSVCQDLRACPSENSTLPAMFYSRTTHCLKINKHSPQNCFLFPGGFGVVFNIGLTVFQQLASYCKLVILTVFPGTRSSGNNSNSSSFLSNCSQPPQLEHRGGYSFPAQLYCTAYDLL